MTPEPGYADTVEIRPFAWDEGHAAHVAHAIAPAIRRAVDIRKNAVASLELQFFDGDTEIERKRGNIVDLWMRSGANGLVEEMQASLDLQGTAYLKIEENNANEVTGFYTLPGHRTRPIVDPKTHQVVQYQTSHRGRIFKFAADEVLQVNDYAPGLSLVGIPLFKAAALSYRSLIDTQRLQQDLVQRGGEFSMLLTSPEGRGAINDPAKMRRLRLKFRKRYRQQPSQRAPMALPAGIKPEKTQLTPAELRIPEMRRMSREEIYEVYGVPLWLVGMQTGEGIGSGGSARASERSFYEHTVIPCGCRLEWALTMGLLSRFNPNWSCAFSYDHVFALQLAMLEKAEMVQKATGCYPLTLNEGRDILGYERFVGEEYDKPTPMPVAPAAAGGENVAPGSLDPGAAAAPSADKKPKPKKQPAYSARVAAERRTWREKAMEREARHALRYVHQLLDQQERRVLVRLEGGRAHAERIVDVVDLLAESDDDRQLLSDMIQDLIERQGQEELGRLVEDADFKATNARVAGYHSRQTNRALAETTETTRAALRDRLAELAGDAQEGVVAAVRQAFDDRRANAVTIARTESASAYNFATVEAWRQTDGMVRGKRWVAIIDEHTRESHRLADGQEVGLEEPFVLEGPDGEERLMFPGDADGSPGNTINCRCALDFVLAEELQVGRVLSFVARALGRSPDRYRNGNAPTFDAIMERSKGWLSRTT